MATHSVLKAKSATLSGTTQDVVTLTGATQSVSIVNRHASEMLWFTIGKTDSGSISAGGDDVRVATPGIPVVIETGGWLPVVVRLLGNSNPYTIQSL